MQLNNKNTYHYADD